jgi:nitrous-oxide reductase
MNQETTRPAIGRTAWIAIVIVAVVALVGGLLVGRVTGGAGAGGDLATLADARGLTVEEAEGALKTYVAPGEWDDYVIVSSGGHSGQVHFVGVPSMRLLKTVPVFTPESWSGYGQGSDLSELVLAEGSSDKQARQLAWGDTHHPALSETGGVYDGRWLYIQDRANGRLGFVELKDFKTKQIVDVPNIQTSHGGAFVTPDSQYIHISSMTPVPQTEDGYAELDEYAEKFRGISSFMAIDPDSGRIDMARSFQVELPPYTQDLADAGKLGSDGLAFIGSYNTEMAVGGVDAEGNKTPIEIGASANDFDFLHVVDWKRAEEVLGTGAFEERNGVRVIPLDTAAAEGILFLVREPRSPHGVDVDPTGNYVVVGGKLDPTVTIYDIGEIRTAMEAGDFEGNDQFGVPILSYDSVMAGQVEVGLGPLHTQFDGRGHGFTSLFLDSAVAKFTLGEKAGVAADETFQLVDKVDVHYNIGHLAASEGDTVEADGRYLVALNKWSIDRFPVLGTLKPQNFQLIDLEADPMRVIYDMPIGFGEPHYVQMIRRDRLTDALEVYEPGTEPLTMAASDVATVPGEESVDTSTPGEVHVYMTALRSHFTPDIIRVRQGDEVWFHVTNVETTPDATHGFAVPSYNVQASLDPGEVVSIRITADRPGSFAFYCTEFCSALHLEMQGWLLVEPVAGAEPAPEVSPASEPAPEATAQPAPEATLEPAPEATAEPEATPEPVPVATPVPATPDAAPVVAASEFKYEPAQVTVAAGATTTITLVNTGVVEHDLTVDELGFQVAVAVGETAEGVLADPPPGIYEFYCTVPGHQAAGMVGTLVVVE